MTRWFISHHQGAVDWARRQNLSIDRFVPHLNTREVREGDAVMGTLPVELAAEVCRRGAKFYALCFSVDEMRRGVNLDADELDKLGARLQRYYVTEAEVGNEL